jgi:hypothetical protein
MLHTRWSEEAWPQVKANGRRITLHSRRDASSTRSTRSSMSMAAAATWGRRRRPGLDDVYCGASIKRDAGDA